MFSEIGIAVVGSVLVLEICQECRGGKSFATVVHCIILLMHLWCPCSFFMPDFLTDSSLLHSPRVRRFSATLPPSPQEEKLEQTAAKNQTLQDYGLGDV